MRKFLLLGAVILCAVGLLALATGVLADDDDDDNGDDGGSRPEHWGVITRNTIGSAVAEPRTGPYGSFRVTGPAGRPPFGKGSLGIAVSDAATAGVPPSEKVDFGNEVDFVDDPVLAINHVGFHVFQTGENASPNPENMPNIRFEIDPNLTTGPGDNYTTMVWVPDAAPVTNRWSGFIDATSTGYWYFTGNEGLTTGCNQVTQCSFAQAKASLNDGPPPPVMHTAAVGKGRDQAWVGAVDGLRIQKKVYDFEDEPVVVRERTVGGDD